jgi:monoamine oxidase
LEPEARFLIAHHIRSEYTVEPAELSLFSFIQDVATYADVPDEGIEAYRICGGNSQLPQALAAAFASAPECKLMVNTPLTAVRLAAGAVTVSHVHGDVTADYAIIATPLPPLRHVTFTPPLPPQLAAAINHLGYGAVTKLMLQYERRFWPEWGADGRLITDLPIGSVYEATDQQEGETGILTVYVAGKFDALFRRQAEAAQIETAATQLEIVYPGSRHLLQTGRTVSWASEGYNGGSYSALKPGQALTLGRTSWDSVGENGRLYFAGEHTDPLYAAYMEGAVRSGQRVAGKIVARERYQLR